MLADLGLQIPVLLLYKGYHFITHYYFALAKALCKKLLYGNLWLVAVEVVHHNLIGILDEAVVGLSLQFEALLGDEFGHQWTEQKKRVMDDRQKVDGNALLKYAQFYGDLILDLFQLDLELFKICADVSFGLGLHF